MNKPETQEEMVRRIRGHVRWLKKEAVRRGDGNGTLHHNLVIEGYERFLASY